MHKLKIGLLLISLIPLKAYSETNDFLFMSLDELLQVEIMGSTLTPENMKTVPSAVTVFTRKEIRRMGLETLGELMGLVPGFQAYHSSGSSIETPFSSRGRRIGLTPAEILVMVDGQRFDSPRSSGNATLAPAYPLKHIEKVEFIRGPGAAVYGSNAMMGVINIVTVSGVNELSVSSGSLGRRQAFVQLAEKFSGLTLDVTSHFEEDDGEDYNVQDTFSASRIDTDDPRKLADINIKLSWENTRVNIQHNEFKVHNFYELNTLSNDFNSRDARISSVSLKHDFDWQSVDSYFWLSFRHVDSSVSSQFTAPGDLTLISNPSSSDALFLTVDFDNYKEARAQLHNDWEINNHSSLQFGLELRQIDAPESLASNNFDLGDLANLISPVRYYGDLLPTTPVQAKSSRDILGLYTQYQHEFSDTTNLILGLRYDDFSHIGSQISPRLGIVHELNSQQNLKFLYGEAFRAPSEGELNLLNNPVVLGNPDLEPETVQSIDVIWIGQWPQTSVSLGYFENRFDDSIVLTDTGSGTLQYQNISQDPIKGYEFEFSYEFNDYWILRGAFTCICEKPDLSFREAGKLSSIVINYQQNRWNANLIATYSGEREMSTGGSDANLITLNDYWLLYAKMHYSFTDELSGFIQAKNLLDEEYYTPPANSSFDEGIPNRGRELLIGVSWEY